MQGFPGQEIDAMARERGAFNDLLLRFICLITLAIFIVDTLTSFEIAVAVLYVLVIMIATTRLSVRGIRLLAVICSCLTLTAFLLSHHNQFFSEALARCLVSLVAIAVAGWLAVKSRKVTDRLREQFALLSQTHDAIIVCTFDSRIRSWNSGAEALYGWTADEVIGRDCWDLLCSRSSQAPQAIKAELLEKGVWEGELIETTRAGKEVTILSRWSLHRDQLGNPRAILASNNDVTDRRLAEVALHRSQAELAHVSRVSMLGELGTSIAHEVNQSLAAIVTNAEAAQRWLDRADAHEARVAIARVASNARRASDVIQRIREHTRKAEPRHECLDIESVVSESLTLLERDIQHRRIQLFRSPVRRLTVRGDRIQLQQVMINLLINGIDAIDEREGSTRHLYIEVCEQDQQVQVTVRDSGTGIEEEHLDMLFNAFFTTKDEGIGIGLPICRSIIEVHGGRIWADSRAGEGATLSFVLPRVCEEVIA